jgi:hypothetical protein
MGLVYAAEKDEDFASLKDSREFAEVVALFQKNRSPVGDAAHAFTVHEKGLVPESVAYDPDESLLREQRLPPQDSARRPEGRGHGVRHGARRALERDGHEG